MTLLLYSVIDYRLLILVAYSTDHELYKAWIVFRLVLLKGKKAEHFRHMACFGT